MLREKELALREPVLHRIEGKRQLQLLEQQGVCGKWKTGRIVREGSEGQGANVNVSERFV